MASELQLGTSILSRGGRTIIPTQVLELLDLKYTPQGRGKLLWTQEGDEIVVTKGTLQSSYEKSILGRGGRAAVPKHIRKALKLESTLQREERIVWVRKGNEVVVRKGTSPSRSIE